MANVCLGLEKAGAPVLARDTSATPSFEVGEVGKQAARGVRRAKTGATTW